MEQDSLRLLEFQRVLEEIALYAKSPASRELILSIRPFKERKDIENRFHLLRDLRRLLSEVKEISLDYFDDISGLLQKVRPEGSFLDPEELYTLRKVFINVERIKGYLRKRDDLPALYGFISGMGDFEELIELIDRSVDDEGNILDTASFELREIRQKRRNIEGRIRKRLDEIIHDRQLAQAIQDEYITLRGGRWVIPLKADFKGRIPGVIHDVSRTGETIYVEPLEVIGLANEHENLIAEEKAEEIKVLKAISSVLRRDLSVIEGSYKLLLEFDLIRSIALFSERLGLIEPEINNELRLKLFKARHPVLILLKEKGLIDEVVPLDLELGGSQRGRAPLNPYKRLSHDIKGEFEGLCPSKIMVITGPNAGGKTIALKTAGLLTLMALSGIPLPAKEASLPLVRNLLVDMGDEQSIEENLSTFSGHIKNISEIMNRADGNSLVLLDELGRATDPSEGAALSCAILEELNKKQSLVIATTHLLEVAAFAHKADGMVNASMEFDESLMRPLYILRTGEPGRSYGIHIAERFGLQHSIIERAKELIGKARLDLQLMLRELREKREFYEQEIESLKVIEKELKEKERLIHEKESEIEKKQEELLRKALEEAKGILNETKVFVNQLLLEAKKRPKEALKSLRSKESEIEAALKGFKKEQGVFIPEPGSRVYVRSLGYDGTVTRISSDRVRIIAGALEAEVSLNDIEAPRGISISPPQERFTEESVDESINLTGMKVEEALSRLEAYLNHASLAGLNEVKVIHGYGTGRLRNAIREYLKGHPLIETFSPGSNEEGGDGVTIVKLK